MKHYPHDLSDVIIHPLYKTKQFEYILNQLFVILYPTSCSAESNKFATVIKKTLTGYLDAYKAYQQCCATLIMSYILEEDTKILFVLLDILDENTCEYPAKLAVAEAMVNMLENDCMEEFDYWNKWFEERGSAFDQWIFMQFVELLRNND